MSEHEIIRCVKRHFGASIAREIRPTIVKTVEEFVKLLDEIEYEQKRTLNPYDYSGNREKNFVVS